MGTPEILRVAGILAVFLVLATFMYGGRLPALIALPMMAVVVAIIGGLPAGQIVTEVLGEGTFRLAQAMVAAFAREACSAGDDGLIRLDLRGGDGRLEIRLGPVSSASGDELLELQGPAELGPLAALADAAAVETHGDDRVMVAARFAAVA